MISCEKLDCGRFGVMWVGVSVGGRRRYGIDGIVFGAGAASALADLGGCAKEKRSGMTEPLLASKKLSGDSSSLSSRASPSPSPSPLPIPERVQFLSSGMSSSSSSGSGIDEAVVRIRPRR
jgi:hypothetical protein